MPEKVLHVTHTDIRSDSRILKEMESLADAGYELHGIGVVHDEGAKHSVTSFEADIAVVNLLVRKLTILPVTFRHALTTLELAIKILPKILRRQPDVIHCHDTLALPLGVIAKLLTKCKLVYDAHELESNRNGLTKLQGRLTAFAERQAWRYVDALIVVSPSIQKWYDEHIGPKRSEIILNSPVFDNETASDNDYLRNKFSVPSDTKIFIYVGILGAGRGIELITEAFLHPDTSSHLVFLGYGELSAKLGELAIEHSNIHVHEAVAHAEVVSIVQSADYGLCLVQNVSLSDYYCLPNKLFEYCFAGIPVLASNFPDIETILLEYNLGQVCDVDANEIRLSIQDLECSRETHEFRDLMPLSWQSQEQKLTDLYRKNLLTRV